MRRSGFGAVLIEVLVSREFDRYIYDALVSVNIHSSKPAIMLTLKLLEKAQS
jgi:hypothetical protein